MTGSSWLIRRPMPLSGSTGFAVQSGDGPGLLNAVDGLDLVPPYSDLVVHATTMGLPPAPTVSTYTTP